MRIQCGSTHNRPASTDLMWTGSLFLGQDRADITFAVNELCQRMSVPSQHSFSKLKRRVRWRQRNAEVVKCGGRTRGTPFESVHKKTEDHRQKQCRGRIVCSSTGERQERMGVQSMTCDLGFALASADH